MNERKATIYELKRLCEETGDCFLCPLKDLCHTGIPEIALNADKANRIILKWIDEHPKKTYADDFYEKFPNAEKDLGRPRICVNRIYPGAECDCKNKICDSCWRKPYKEESNDE